MLMTVTGGMIFMPAGTVVGSVLFFAGMRRQKRLQKEEEDVQR